MAVTAKYITMYLHVYIACMDMYMYLYHLSVNEHLYMILLGIATVYHLEILQYQSL